MVFGNFLINYAKNKRGQEPRFNVPYSASFSQSMFGSGNLNLKKFFMHLYKQSPELNAVITAVAGDIAG